MVLEYFRLKNDFESGKAPVTIYKFSSIVLWVKIVLIGWFRMIFVCSVFQEPIPIPLLGGELEPVTAHTLGFFGMQFALVLIAVDNVLQIMYTGQRVMNLSPRVSVKVGFTYCIVVAIVTGLKISWASSIFITGTPWIDAPWPHIFDRTWMLLVAVMPLVFSYYGIKFNPVMQISITQTKQ